MYYNDRSRKKAAETESYNELIPFCEDNNIEMGLLSDYHTRLKRGKLTIDIFPHNKKYHIIKGKHNKNIRGRYNNLIFFVSEFFA